MPTTGAGLQHFHARKRMHLEKQPYPHPDPLKRWVDRLIYVAVFASPIMTIPQIVKIWSTHSAAGVSALSWGTYFFLSFFWLGYGILHREKPIIMAYTLWIVMNGLVMLGALMYG